MRSKNQIKINFKNQIKEMNSKKSDQKNEFQKIRSKT